MSRVFWDTNLFIYLIEGQGARWQLVTRLANAIRERGDQLITSTLTLGELLVKPRRDGNSRLAAEYEALLAKHASLIALDVEAARIYARIRRDSSIKSPDAIQLACAASARVDLFITNDARLSGKIIDGIQFIVSLDRAPL
ncbi:MAG: PIN domain-containing protein [Candidatus Acidiferrales bacterium]